MFFAIGWLADSFVVELFDNLFTYVTRFKSVDTLADTLGEVLFLTHRANPTPRPFPLASRRIRLEHTTYGVKIAPSS
jgi:hypothetical protein